MVAGRNLHLRHRIVNRFDKWTCVFTRRSLHDAPLTSEGREIRPSCFDEEAGCLLVDCAP